MRQSERIEQRWQDIEADIICPLTSSPCKKDEAGVRRLEDVKGHNTIIFKAECNFCGSKASGWGER